MHRLVPVNPILKIAAGNLMQMGFTCGFNQRYHNLQFSCVKNIMLITCLPARFTFPAHDNRI